MQVLTVANQKGGVGKSTISLNIFGYCVDNNLKSVFIDLDPQGNSSKSLSSAYPDMAKIRSFDLIASEIKTKDIKSKSSIIFNADAKLVEAEKKGDNLGINLQVLAEHYDVCIIDTPPTASYLQIRPLMLSDYVISPIELSSWSYDGSMPFLTMLSNLRKASGTKTPVFLGLLPNRVWVQSPKQKADLETIMTEPKLKQNLLGKGSFYIPIRHAYVESSETGKPVWAFKNKSSARAEGINMKKICDFILKSMNIKTGV